MRAVRVWLNHWFSTAYHIIRLLKADELINFIVIGSNTNTNCVYRAVCSEWVTEPEFDSIDAYVDYCLEFCRKHNIDVFLPRRNMLAVSRRLAEFDAMGIKVLVERDYLTMSALCDKAKTYQMFKESGIGYVPPYCVVTSAEEYKAAYRFIKLDDNRVCLKLAIDEGAASFRVVDNRIEGSLKKRSGSKITYEDSVKALSKLGEFPDLLVMPYLSGEEVSVDCLYMPDGGHIAIPRYKSQGRSETIRFEKEIVDVCHMFLDRFKLNYPCNLQFKYDKDVPYLLEVNTRMSGGIQFSCVAAGINIPNIAVNRLLGIEKQADYDRETWVVSYVETPVILW